VSGIDEHAFGHSDITPERATTAAERKSAGGAILCAEKPAAPEIIPSSDDWTWAMANLVWGAAIGFGFLQSASAGAATGAAADSLPVISRLRRNAPLGATPSQRTAVFRTHNL
jgi:hypothetical protein